MSVARVFAGDVRFVRFSPAEVRVDYFVLGSCSRIPCGHLLWQ
jgi:hypothetical protein